MTLPIINPPATITMSQPAPKSAGKTSKPFYQRVVLKISGEAFCKSKSFGIDSDELRLIANEIAAAAKMGSHLSVVVGGGNIIRGARLAEEGIISQATADYMGMLGTAINGLALKEALDKVGVQARVLTALNLTSVAEPFIRGRALRHLEKNRVVIFACGTGNPFFTTDTAAALRAAEINADVLLKATKVDGVYDQDPHKYPDAKRYEKITYKQALAQDLNVMDRTAFAMLMERKIPLVVFNMKTPGHIAEVVSGKMHGTQVTVE